jgi:hypothetical protein
VREAAPDANPQRGAKSPYGADANRRAHPGTRGVGLRDEAVKRDLRQGVSPKCPLGDRKKGGAVIAAPLVLAVRATRSSGWPLAGCCFSSKAELSKDVADAEAPDSLSFPGWTSAEPPGATCASADG